MKMYHVTKHAIDRSVERLGIATEQAKNHIVNIMQTAFYNGSIPHADGKMRRVYDHHKTRTRIIVSDDGKSVITVYKVPESAPIINVNNDIIAKAHATIQRELTKARRSFTQETRKLKIEQAELGVEIAQAKVNKARCKAPHTKSLIQERIDAMQTYYDAIGARLDEIQTEYSRKKSEASEFLPI